MIFALTISFTLFIGVATIFIWREMKRIYAEDKVFDKRRIGRGKRK